jgi:hypothetical protein
VYNICLVSWKQILQNFETKKVQFQSDRDKQKRENEKEDREDRE